ncbi:MAG: transposase [Bacteroidetes bacterium]|nr:transposase [Bacteroidota bacterium]
MKNIVKLDNYYHPEQLIDAIRDFVEYYNHDRYHESLQNVTPSAVYYGRKEQILHLNNETLYNQPVHFL